MWHEQYALAVCASVCTLGDPHTKSVCVHTLLILIPETVGVYVSVWWHFIGALCRRRLKCGVRTCVSVYNNNNIVYSHTRTTHSSKLHGTCDDGPEDVCVCVFVYPKWICHQATKKKKAKELNKTQTTDLKLNIRELARWIMAEAIKSDTHTR